MPFLDSHVVRVIVSTQVAYDVMPVKTLPYLYKPAWMPRSVRSLSPSNYHAISLRVERSLSQISIAVVYSFVVVAELCALRLLLICSVLPTRIQSAMTRLFNFLCYHSRQVIKPTAEGPPTPLTQYATLVLQNLVRAQQYPL